MSTTRDPEHDGVMRRLHRFYEGVIAIEERFERTFFVLDPSTGRPVFPAPPGALEGESLTLYIPEDEPGSLQVVGAPVELDPLRDEACDRWMIYFGKARWSRYAAIQVDHIKSVDVVMDGESLRGNPLRAVEGAICRGVNADTSTLVTLCQQRAKVSPMSPRLVGVDPYGLDVRAEFGPVRIEWEGVHVTEAEARGAIEMLLKGG